MPLTRTEKYFSFIFFRESGGNEKVVGRDLSHIPKLILRSGTP